MNIFPAIDILNGKCVRLHQGDFGQATVYDDPINVALKLYRSGIKHLHLVDLDGAQSGSPQNLHHLAEITTETDLIIDFGGGVRTTKDFEAVLKAGAKKINCGSIAVKDKQLVTKWIESFGADTIILSADVKEMNIAVSGWGESTTIHINDFIDFYAGLGIKYVTCTDISKDGTLLGPNFNLYKNLLEIHNIFLIASGGIASKNDLLKLEEIGLFGAIVGKAYYENKITIEEMAEFG